MNNSNPNPAMTDTVSAPRGDVPPGLESAIASAQRIAANRTRPRFNVEDYLVIGKYLSGLKAEYPYTKEMGRIIKRDAPELVLIDSPLRSNCSRLYEALNGFRDADILEVLGVKDIRDYRSSNPTVIIRNYLKAKKAKAPSGC